MEDKIENGFKEFFVKTVHCSKNPETLDLLTKALQEQMGASLQATNFKDFSHLGFKMKILIEEAGSGYKISAYTKASALIWIFAALTVLSGFLLLVFIPIYYLMGSSKVKKAIERAAKELPSSGTLKGDSKATQLK